MEAYQQRVVDEYNELHDKRAKLAVFIQPSNGVYAKLPMPEKVLLLRQHRAMLEFEEILYERIQLFPKDAAEVEAEQPAAEGVKHESEI